MDKKRRATRSSSDEFYRAMTAAYSSPARQQFVAADGSVSIPVGSVKIGARAHRPTKGERVSALRAWDWQLHINNRPRYRRTGEAENPENNKLMALQITFRNMEPSPAVTTRIELAAAKLDRYHPRITSCRVVLEAPHRQHKAREGFHISIHIDAPRAQIVVRHEPTQRRSMTAAGATKWAKHLEARRPNNDIYIVIRDAFVAARRQLEDYARRMRGEVKIHSRTPALRVEKHEQLEQIANSSRPGASAA